MSNDVFDLPPRDGMSDPEYIECLEASIRVMGQIIATNEQRLLAADTLLKAVLCSLPSRSATVTPQSLSDAPRCDIKYSTDAKGHYVIHAKERTHVKH